MYIILFAIGFLQQDTLGATQPLFRYVDPVGQGLRSAQALVLEGGVEKISAWLKALGVLKLEASRSLSRAASWQFYLVYTGSARSICGVSLVPQ